MRATRGLVMCAGILMLLLGTGSAHADGPAPGSGCPLSNPLYRDLRSAAAALERRVNLPASCEEMQKKLEEASKQIKTAADSLTRIPIDFGDEKVTRSLAQGTLPDGSVELRQAVSGIVDIGNLVSRFGGDDRCGKALLSRADWVEALVDTVNSLMPYVLLVGGRSPQTTTLVLSATAVASSVKTFITLHRSTAFDMRQSGQRQAFIENACAFYDYNEAVRGLVRARAGESSDVDLRVRELQKALEKVDARKPAFPEPARDVLEQDLALKKDRAHLAELESAVARLPENELFVCHVVRSEMETIRGGGAGVFPLGSITRLEKLLGDSAAKGFETVGRKLLATYLRKITDPGQYQDDADPKCVRRSREWLVAVRQVLEATDQELARPGRRDLGGTDEYKKRTAWEEERKIAQTALDLSKARQRFLQAIATQGEQLEMSELLDTRDGIFRALFSDESRNLMGFRLRRKSPAESWLEHKWRQSRAKLLEFDKMSTSVEESVKRPLPRYDSSILAKADRARRCAAVESALLSWTTALRHQEASKLFCRTFSSILTESSAADVFAYCEGKFDKEGKTVSLGLIDNLDTEVQGREPQVTEFSNWLAVNGCVRTADINLKPLN